MKNKSLNIWMIWLVVLLLNSCASTSQLEDDLTQIKFTDVEEGFKISDSFAKIKCIQLEMTDRSVVGGRVRRVIDADGIIVVLANEEILLFDKEDGKFLRKLGAIGEGPGEYLYVSDIMYDTNNKSIIAYDWGKKSLLTYKLSGEFLKQEPDKKLLFANSMEISSDGTILANNMLFPSSFHSEYAFTIKSPDKSISEIDPFYPLHSEESATPSANRPITRHKDELRFVKLFTDTVFTIKERNLSPLYKLNFGKRMVSKEAVAQLGEFPGTPHYATRCNNKEELSVIDEMFETEDYIILVPHPVQHLGYYWIDKRDNRGFRISSPRTANSEYIKAAKGETIHEIVAADKDEIICWFDAMSGTDLFKLSFAEVGDKNIFPKEVVSAIENFDPEGNPFLIFYEH